MGSVDLRTKSLKSNGRIVSKLLKFFSLQQRSFAELPLCSNPVLQYFPQQQLMYSCAHVDFSGIATPRHTRACAHIKFTGARVKIMWKAKVKDQLLDMCDRFHVDVK